MNKKVTIWTEQCRQTDAAGSKLQLTTCRWWWWEWWWAGWGGWWRW